MMCGQNVEWRGGEGGLRSEQGENRERKKGGLERK